MQWGIQCLKACHIANNSSVELESSWISADPIGRVSQHCSQALDSRRTEDDRLRKERTSEPAHARRGNWMHRNILTPSTGTLEQKLKKKSLENLWLEKEIRMSSWWIQRAALTCACKWDHEDQDRAETAILASLQALRVFCWGQNWMGRMAPWCTWAPSASSMPSVST